MTPNKKLVLQRSDLVLSLKSGSVVLLPTDTLPALAALPEYASKLWEIKQRPSNKPLILMGASNKELLKFVDPSVSKEAMAIAEKYWPGALTLVLPSNGRIVEALNPGGLTLGMRVPSCDLVRELLRLTGPLATTSANLSGKKPAQSAFEAMDYFPFVPLLGPLPWSKPSGSASTVMTWGNQGGWEVLREGLLIPEEVRT